MEHKVASADEALALCRSMQQDGRASLFRGQTRDWPQLIPSLLRLAPGDLAAAEQRASAFQDWAAQVPQMSPYWGSELGVRAIAQHYGIPTNLLDLTEDPEIALLFSKSETDPAPAATSVIYCFKPEALEKLRSGRVVRVEVENLWRLEAQSGLFLEYLDPALADLVRGVAEIIHFPAGRLTAAERTRLYPVRRSALETVIDQWLYRTEIEGLQKALNAPNMVLMRRQTYPGAFRWRDTPQLHPDWVGGEAGWITAPVESVRVVDDPRVVSMTPPPGNDPASIVATYASVLSEPIAKARSTQQLLSFEVALSPAAEHLSGSVSTIINRCWDGLRLFPYETDELVSSLALICAMLVARAEGVDDVDSWEEQIFGETILLETAPVGGHIEAGSVSKAALRAAFRPAPPAALTRFMARVWEKDPFQAMDYIVDPHILFDFSKFRRVFVTQLIPSAVDAYWREDLSLYEGALGCMWGISFNPALLGYATIASYRFTSPLTTEADCDRVIYIVNDMDSDDIEELFVSCMPTILRGEGPFVVRFHGYGHDPREIYDIARAKRQARAAVKASGTSVMEVTSTLVSREASPRTPFSPPQGLGAFELWLMAQGRLGKLNRRKIRPDSPMFQRFWSELKLANQALEMKAKAQADWPSP